MILVAVVRKDPRASSPDASSIEELGRLSATAGGRVVEVLIQRLTRLHPGTLIGSGKMTEVALAVKRRRAKTVIFDADLTPAQQENLEKALGAKIVDRTRLILDIFAKRARTKEGELQVELAQLSYMLPRLTGSWRAFSQQVGGIGTRGPGERKIEYERRHVQYRIKHLKKDIERLKRERAVQRRRRRRVPVPTIAIIGYTNAGKSSVLNKLTAESRRPEAAQKKVYADDKLFATLDPTSRRVRMPEGGWAVFTDTVGFISKLPTSLIAAFRSTLEEAAEADCLLHLEDGASPELAMQRRTVESVLGQLGANNLPRVRALNKSDLLARQERAALEKAAPERLLVSAKTGENLSLLLGRIQAVLNHRWLLREIALPYAAGRHLKEIYASAQVIGRGTRNGRMVLRLRVTPENWTRLLARIG